MESNTLPVSRLIGLLLGPVLFLVMFNFSPFVSLSPEAQRVLAVAAWMLVWWISEAVDLAVTALLPLLMFPLLQLSELKTVAQSYADPMVYLFMGGFMLALAMEKWGLHLRIALNIVRLTGTNADGIILGFMLATGFLSMWISNTATTVMMLPIANSVINLLSHSEHISAKGLRNFRLTMILGVAHAANVGGIATLIGTPPNLAFATAIKKLYGVEIGFGQWFLVGFPFASLLLIANYWAMVKWLYPNRLGDFGEAEQIINHEVLAMGKMSRGEILVAIIFLLTALAWIFQPSLNLLYRAAGIPFRLDDVLIALIAMLALFITPVYLREGIFVLEWSDTARMAWGILLLFGGGIALASMLDKAGIIALIGKSVGGLHLGDNFIILIVLIALMVFLTEIMSNIALVLVMVPVVASVAVGLGENPILMTLPITLASSCAFMLPMATPPNAIVFSSGYVRVAQMARVGFVLNIISILMLIVFSYFVLPWVFGIEFGKLPAWAR